MVFSINIKSFFSIIISKFTLFLSKNILKGGTNFPGTVALKIDKNILKTITKNYDVIFVTGTNGKTTTTNMIYNIIKESGKEVITNSSGANMITGITSCFIKNFTFKNKEKKKYAVIEVDEANLKFLTEYINPSVITITNLFRDQLDRYGEVYTTLEKIMEGVIKVPFSKLVLNGDESLLGKLDVPNQRSYYGFKAPIGDNKIDINADAKFCKFCKSPYSYNFVSYNHLGDYYCDNCGYKRPQLDYYVDKVISQTPEGSDVSMNDTDIYVSQPGVYNIYNALCAYSVAREIDVNPKVIKTSLEQTKSSFGRQEKINIDNKELKIILVKNPAGYNQAINTVTLNENKVNLAFLLNDKYADGTDVSWIWDVNFEKLTAINLDKIFIGGIRLYDMAVRLKTAGFNTDNFTLCEDYNSLLENIKSSSEDTVYVLATYTAMTSFRKYLHTKGYIDKMWE